MVSTKTNSVVILTATFGDKTWFCTPEADQSQTEMETLIASK